MEKCKFEHEEMLCRKGCRCEQQYRLHRLLAFDPNNECRGIFSDWFRFPSYCICKFILTGNIQVPSFKDIQFQANVTMCHKTSFPNKQAAKPSWSPKASP